MLMLFLNKRSTGIYWQFVHITIRDFCIIYIIYHFILIYIHSIPARGLLLKGRLFMFADDIALVNVDNNNWEELKPSVEGDL